MRSLGRRFSLNRVSSLTLAGLIGATASFAFWLLSAHRTPIEAVGHATTVVLVAGAVNSVTAFGFTVGLLRAQARGTMSRQSLGAAVAISAAGSVVASLIPCLLWGNQSLHEAGLSRPEIFVGIAVLSGTLAVSTMLDTLAASGGNLFLPPVRNIAVLVIRCGLIFAFPQLTVASLCKIGRAHV